MDPRVHLECECLAERRQNTKHAPSFPCTRYLALVEWALTPRPSGNRPSLTHVTEGGHRDPVSSHVVRNAEGDGNLHRQRPAAQPGRILHHPARPIRQWILLFAKQYASAP